MYYYMALICLILFREQQAIGDEFNVWLAIGGISCLLFGILDDRVYRQRIKDLEDKVKTFNGEK